MKPKLFIWNFLKFYKYVRIAGELEMPGNPVRKLTIVQAGTPIGSGQIGIPGKMSDKSSFLVEFTCPAFDASQIVLVFECENGARFQITGSEAAEYYLKNEVAANRCEREFFETLRGPGYDRVLEIGSRARSGVIRRGLFEGKQYTGIDILDGPNVDVIGDAHMLSSYFADDSFDAIYSVSTFEHLAMPWKVALEMNRVLRPGGLAYLVTHQALGVHERPWDFWRFSDTSWDALFNTFTGFRKEATFLGAPMKLVPVIYFDHWKDYEGEAGYAISAVLVRKTGRSNLTWNVDVRQAVAGNYPQ